MNRGSKPTSMSARPVWQPAVTFVIPVFNKERYLEQCLESVVAQSLDETEIICVNDGSTDASGQILAKFAGLDRRLCVIDNGSNLGAGHARNRGIAAATGRFIRFIDADDLLPRESTERLYRRAIATESDLVRGGLAVFRREDASDPQPMIELSDRITTLREERSLWIPYWHTSYLMARSLLLDHKLSYPRLRRGEDPVFMASVLVHARQIALLAETVYLYRRYPKTAGAAGTSYADVTDTLASAMSIKSLFIEKCPECWHQGYAPYLLEDFRKFIARCRLDAQQREFVASSAKALWGPEADLEPVTASHAAR